MHHSHKKSETITIDQHESIIVAGLYIIDKKIGKGSFGEVYKGYRKDTMSPVAIKIVSLI
jgi:serine/threonine protein kinase